MSIPPPPDESELAASLAFAGRLAAALLRDPHAADDVAQEAVLARIEAGTRPVRSARAWLAGAVRNLVRMRIRSQRRRERREAQAPRREASADPARLAEQLDAHRAVAAALQGMQEPYRGTLLLRYFHGRSVAEIAADGDVPHETVRTRLRRGLDLLRARLDADPARRTWRAVLAPLATAARVGPPATAVGTAGAVGGMGATLALGLAAAAVAAGVWFGSRDHAPDAPRAREHAQRDDERGRVGPTLSSVASGRDPRAAKDDLPAAVVRGVGAEGEQAAVGATFAERLASLRVRMDLRGTDPIDALGELSTCADVDIDLTPLGWDSLTSPGRFAPMGERPRSGLEILRLVLGVPWTEAAAAGWLRIQEPRTTLRPRDDAWVRVPRRPAVRPSAYPTFSVVVVDPDGNPLRGAELVEDTSLWRVLGTADAEGRIAVPARAWAHRLKHVVRMAGYRDSPPLQVPRGIAPGERIEVRMSERAAHVRGVVRDPEGRPVVGAALAVIDLSRADALTAPPARFVRTGADGAFDEPCAPSGGVLFVAYAAGHGRSGLRLTTSVDTVTEVEIRLALEATVSGTVRDASGTPVPDALVLARAEGLPDPIAWATSDRDGRYRIDQLPVGLLTITVRDGHGRPVDVALSAGEQASLDLLR